MAQKNSDEKTVLKKAKQLQFAGVIVACIIAVCAVLLIGFQVSQAAAGQATGQAAGATQNASSSSSSTSGSASSSANSTNSAGSTYSALDTTTVTATSDWLASIRDDTKLSTLTLPGTHDSATYNFVKNYVTKSYAQCQDMTIENQLLSGVRVFDLRYVYNHDSDGQFTIWHGYGNTLNFDYQCADSDGTAQTLPKILTKFKTYLAAHPNEFVVVNLQREGGDSAETQLSALCNQYGIVSGYASSSVSSLRGKIVNCSGVLQSASGDYNDWTATESEKISQMKNCFTAAPTVTKSYSGSITHRAIYTNLSFNSGGTVKSVRTHAQAVLSGFFEADPFTSYGMKAYGMVVYDFPTTNVINMTINANYWANWNYYTVKFDTKTSSTIESQSVREGLKATKPSDPSFEGMTFDGWYTDTNYTTKWDFSTNTVSSDMTLYAKWVGKITYNLNGGTNATDNPSSYVYGKGISSFSPATKNQALFGGWFWDSSFTTKATSISTMQSGEVKLYAKWDACHEISDAKISVSDVTYNAQAQTPAVSLTYKSEKVDESNYTLAYSNNTNAGTGKITITGKNDFIGQTTATFTIKPAAISDASFNEISAQTYTGLGLQPAITGSFNSTTLTSADFDATYSNNVDVGLANTTVAGKGNFEGTKDLSFNIVAAPISNANVSGLDGTFRETGSDVEPLPVLTNPNTGKELEKGTDYTLSYANNVVPGTANITITGKGNWTGTTSKTFTILGDISKATVSDVPAQGKNANGDPITPEPVVTGLSGSLLTPNVDYTLSYENNTNIGTATIYITGAGVYAGTKTSTTFEIRASFSEITISDIEDSYNETGAEIKPEITATDKTGTTLKENVDYTISYSNNLTPGKASMTITGQGNWAGSQVKTFAIIGDLDKVEISNMQSSYLETGSYIIPEMTVTNQYGTFVLTKDKDYELATYDSLAPGTASFTINPKSAYWTGSKSGTFTIKGDMSKARVTGVEETYQQTGSAITPFDTDPKARIFGISSDTVELVRDVDYSIVYANNTDLGTATIKITGLGKYEGTSQDVTFKICGDIRKGTTSGIETSYVETGAAQEPRPVVKDVSGKELTEKQDYTLEYKDNTAPGYAVITVRGTGYYEGVVVLSFKITGDVSLASVSGVASQYVETGSAIKPADLSVVGLSGTTLKQGSDYTLSYGKNIAPGVGTVTITGAGSNYKGTQKTVEFNIAGDISAAKVSGVASSYPETGAEIEPANLNVVGLSGAALTLGSDYILGYENNLLPGSANVLLVGAGAYEGSEQKVAFNIVGDISAAKVSGVAESYVQTGSEIKPDNLSVVGLSGNELVQGSDYTLDYENNVELGIASVLVVGAGAYEGSQQVINFKIVGDISAASVSGVNASYVQTGSEIKPEFVVTSSISGAELVLGQDYSVEYTNNIEIGTATITITGMGNWINSLQVNFEIIADTPDPDPEPEPEPVATSWQRLAGGTALSTMKAIVNEGWETSKWAVVATVAGYQDALSASALAGLLDNAPVLMTKSDELSSQTKSLLESKGVKNVAIVGGTAAVSSNVETAIKDLDIDVIRISGGTAASTAIEVYKYGKKLGEAGGTSWGSDAIVATADTFQDALSIAPYAYAKHAPIFLTDNKTKDVRSGVVNNISSGGFSRTLIVGGTGAVAQAVEDKVVDARRLAGGTAYTTSKEIANFCLNEGDMSAVHMGVACGTTYQDALVGASLLGKKGSIIVLADDKNSKNVNSVVAKQEKTLDTCYIFGGPSAVSSAVETALNEVSQ